MTWYNTGTVAVTNNNATVTGTGTAWVANGAAGMGWRGPDRAIYEVTSVNSDTQLTLATAYQGSTASGQSYSLMPTQDYIRSLAGQVATLIATYSTIATNAGAGKFGDGSAASPGISWGSNANTGFYKPAANSIGIAVGGVSAVVIDALGRVGFGCTPGIYRFELMGAGSLITGTTNVLARINQDTTRRGLMLGYDSAAQTGLVYADSSGNPSSLAFGGFNGSVWAEFGRFDGAGNLLHNTTAGGNSNLNGFSSDIYVGGVIVNVGHNTSAASGDSYMNFRRGGMVLGSITQVSSTGVAYNTTSDRRLKDNIHPAGDAGPVIDAITVVQHDWCADGSHTDFGVIAQDLHQVFPAAVKTGDDGDEMADIWGVDYSKLVPLLVKELQALRARVVELEVGAGVQP